MNISDEELQRDIRNLYLSPDKEQQLSLEGDEFLNGIYGEEKWAEMKAKNKEKSEKDKK